MMGTPFNPEVVRATHIRSTATLFLAFLCCAIVLPCIASGEEDVLAWHLDDWTFRQVVELAMPVQEGDSNTGLIEIEARPPLIAEDGRDMRLLDERGRSVPFQWMSRNEDPNASLFADGRPEFLRFEITDADVMRYAVYSGNPSAEAVPPASWEERVSGLILETHVNTQGTVARDWEHMQGLLNSSRWKYGSGPRRQINDTENPFGPSEHYIGVYTGKIYCPTTGIYGFATDSDDSSFLRIDGEGVVEWPGGHNPSGSFDRCGTVELEAGVHEIKYYHVQHGGGALAKAGWKPPGTVEYVTIPEENFVREVPTLLLRVEERDSLLNAYFSAAVTDAIRFGNDGPGYVTVSFHDGSRSALDEIVSWEWDFGDGAMSSEANPGHVFLADRTYTVTLRCVDRLGYEGWWTRKLVPGSEAARHINPVMEISATELFLMPDDPLELEVRIRGGDVAPLEVEWIVDFCEPDGPAFHRQRERLTLVPGEWMSRRCSTALPDALPFDVGDIRIHLQYLDNTVLERSLAVRRASDSELSLEEHQLALCGEGSASLALRLSGRPSSGDAGSFMRKVRAGETVRVMAIDEASPDAMKDGYVRLLAGELKRRYPDAHFEVVAFQVNRSADGSDASVRRFIEVPPQVTAAQVDLVILAPALRDVLLFTPVERFERMLHALLERVSAIEGVEVVLLAPPPSMTNPGLAKAYAVAVKRLGLRGGVRVADAYSAFMKYGEAEGRSWEDLYRDPDAEAPIYYVSPTRRGQQLIAATLAAILDQETD